MGRTSLRLLSLAAPGQFPEEAGTRGYANRMSATDAGLR